MNQFNFLPPFTKSTFNGLRLSYVSATQVQIGVGECRDSTDAVNINVNNAITLDITVSGAGATSATHSVYIQNSTPAVLFRLRDDGLFSLGLSATPYDIDSVSIGRLAVTDGTYSTAVGSTSTTGTGAIKASVYGYGASNSGTAGCVFGYLAVGTSTKPVAFGHAATAGPESVSIGADTVSSGAGVALGMLSNATGSENVALGYTANTTGYGAIGVGAYTVTSGSAGIAIGDRAWATATGAIAIGPIARNGIANSFIIGWETTGGQRQSFFVNDKSNMVLDSMVAIAAATHFDTTATNTITIHNGTETSGVIANAIQLYSKDATGSLTTLAIRAEAIPIAIGVKANTEYYPVFINGVEKFIALVA